MPGGIMILKYEKKLYIIGIVLPIAQKQQTRTSERLEIWEKND